MIEKTVEQFSESISEDNLPEEAAVPVYQVARLRREEQTKALQQYAAKMPPFSNDLLITMNHGGELGWKIDPDDPTVVVEVLENVLILDYSPYLGKWETAEGKRYLTKRLLTDTEAQEDDNFKPRIDLVCEYRGEERVIGFPTLGFNATVRLLERYYSRGEDIRDRFFDMKTRMVSGKNGPMTVPVFKEIRSKPETQIVDVPASADADSDGIPF